MAKLRHPVNADDNQQGNPSAPVVLVEYGDYQCPHCGKAYPVVKQLQEEFGDKLLFVFRNFALTKIHPYAFIAAVSTEAAAQQHAFWPMHDWLFENQVHITPGNIRQYAETSGLNMDTFTADQENEQLKEKVENDFVGGMRSGVNATPSFFINGEKVEGPVVYITLRNAILDELNKR
jgi:protein-disulfide isomerase